MKKAKSENAGFTMRQVGELELCYRVAQGKELLVIPRGYGLRRMLLEEVHGSLVGAHLGVRKTTAALAHRVWWPRMAADVARHVRGCGVCQRVKDVNARQQGLLQPLPVPTAPF